MQLERWDPTAKVRYDKRVLTEIVSTRFVDAGKNVVLLGPVSVGKTSPRRCRARAFEKVASRANERACSTRSRGTSAAPGSSTSGGSVVGSGRAPDDRAGRLVRVTLAHGFRPMNRSTRSTRASSAALSSEKTAASAASPSHGAPPVDRFTPGLEANVAEDEHALAILLERVEPLGERLDVAGVLAERPRDLSDPLLVMMIAVDGGALGAVLPSLEDVHELEPGTERAQERDRVEVVVSMAARASPRTVRRTNSWCPLTPS